MQTTRYTFIKILTGSDLSTRRLPLIKIESESSGPTVWLTACGHGDEVGGIVIIQEIVKWLNSNSLLKGNIYAFPLMNPMGFENASRQITYSKEDLNRSFPGNHNGSLAQRLADKIFTTIKNTTPNLVIDLHNDWIRSIPYTLVDLTDSSDLSHQINEFAIVTDFPVVYDTDLIENSLAFSLINQGIPAITLEVGESHIVNEQDVKMGVSAVLKVLQSLGMINYQADIPPSYQFTPDKMLHYSNKPLCSTSGIIRFMVAAGQQVKIGKPIAKIYNVFGRPLETIKTTREGIVLGLSDSSVAFPGMPIASMGYY